MRRWRHTEPTAPGVSNGFPIGHWIAILGALRGFREPPPASVQAVETWVGTDAERRFYVSWLARWTLP